MRRLVFAILTTASLFAADVKYDGAKVHYESYGQGADAVVFIHGWTCDLTFWRAQAPVYEKSRSLLIDLPGHGQSDKPDVSYTQERFARAVEAVMRDAGVERAVLVGHSMGAPVAFTVLRLFPKKVKGIVFVDGFLMTVPKDDAEKEARAKQREQLSKTWHAENYKQSAAGMINSMFTDKTSPELREEIKTKMGAAPQHVLASAFDGMFSMEPPKPGENYPVPMMAVLAKGSAANEAQLRAIFPNLRKYESWQGSGHFLMMESPERFNSLLREFVSGIK